MRAIAFSIFYILWLVPCFIIALPSLFLPFKKKNLDSQFVKKQLTICRCLFEKGIIDEQTYAFETEQVSKEYDYFVFKGYRLIVAPVIFILKRFNFIDKLILFFVERWVGVHKFYLKQSSMKPPQYHMIAVKVCITISRAVGLTLSRLKL